MATSQTAQFRFDRDLPDFSERSRVVDAAIAAMALKTAVIDADPDLEAPQTLVAYAEQTGLQSALVAWLATDLVEVLDIVAMHGGDLNAYDARTIVLDYANAATPVDAVDRGQVLARLIWIVTDHSSDKVRALALGVSDMPEHALRTMQLGEPHHFVAAMLRPSTPIDEDD